ncbi:MAG: U32 family peptidase [Proteobacteria bacterium]|nr:U32 family peptidase [Pseudomonadota bacterium]
MNSSQRPEILAPAGNRTAFLAALAAGADAIYVGLKHFSARMEADNFSMTELAALTELARAKNRRVYVAMNTMVKPGDVESAGRLMDRLVRYVNPAALIVQDLAMINLARQTEFQGELHLSTLANVSQAGSLETIAKMGVSRVVIPRELHIDEIKSMAEACPEGLKLEVFVHGALCYNVSGRCYWSSYMGGKSGLRGRCVQPCRREYEQRNTKAPFFSCTDLSLDVLTRTLASVPQVAAWKIEGRKKGPHYVFYTTSAYRMLRDNGDNPETRKAAMSLLEQSLGRKGSHYFFLPQRRYNPTDPASQSASGLLVAGTGKSSGRKQLVSPRVPLLKADLLRVGFQGEPWHQIVKVTRNVPKGGRLDFMSLRPPKAGTPVFLIDRREPQLGTAIAKLERQLETVNVPTPGPSEFSPALPKGLRGGGKGKVRYEIININRNVPKRMFKGAKPALWLAPKMILKGAVNYQWWMPPVIWPEEESLWFETVSRAYKAGARCFVLGAPWQISLFTNFLAHAKGRPLELWAGPFCNISNALALAELKSMGFIGAVVSPELSREDILELPKHSPLNLGYVTYGHWPLGISRIPPDSYKTEKALTSPMGEVCWTRRYGQNNWVYPGWAIDIRDKEKELTEAGYALFAHIFEPIPREIPKATRVSSFNWGLNLI